jgi:molecular chaperone GrpE
MADEEGSGMGAPEEAPEKSFEEQLEEAQIQARENLDLAKRIQADFDNYRKRTLKEVEESRRYASEIIVSELLGVVDDLERAMAAGDASQGLIEGVRGVHANLLSVLNARGLREIPTDIDFDPSLHEALCATDDEEDGRILEVYQKGYYLGDRVLRYAKVRVTKRKESE